MFCFNNLLADLYFVLASHRWLISSLMTAQHDVGEFKQHRWSNEWQWINVTGSTCHFHIVLLNCGICVFILALLVTQYTLIPICKFLRSFISLARNTCTILKNSLIRLQCRLKENPVWMNASLLAFYCELKFRKKINLRNHFLQSIIEMPWSVISKMYPSLLVKVNQMEVIWLFVQFWKRFDDI